MSEGHAGSCRILGRCPRLSSMGDGGATSYLFCARRYGPPVRRHDAGRRHWKQAKKIRPISRALSWPKIRRWRHATRSNRLRDPFVALDLGAMHDAPGVGIELVAPMQD